MPSHGRVEIVRFTGGEHHGLVVEAQSAVAALLPGIRFQVLAGGRLYDVTEQRRMPGVRVLRRPGEHVERQIGPSRAVQEQQPPPTQPAAAPRRLPPGPPLFQPARHAD